MRGSPAWHARVDIGGIVEGSGFLVSARSVLTCAHVVRHADRAEVVFPGAPGLEPVPAKVAMRGSWAGRTQDPGDVAVLELDQPVPVPPALFAPLDEPHRTPAPKLVAYGFPAGYGEEGVQSELRVASRQLIGGEWTQLEFWKAYGQEPAHGFSGSAALLEDSGAVVGMVTAHDPVTRNGRMIPAQALARHWPVLADLVPTPGHPAEEKQRLRELIARAPQKLPCSVETLLRSAAGPLGIASPAGGASDVWHAVWHLLSETRPRPGSLPLAEFVVRLADLTPDEAYSRELRAWAREHRERQDRQATAAKLAPAPQAAAAPSPSLSPATSSKPGWSPILVELQHSGADQGVLLVEVSAYRDGHRRLVGERRLTRSQVREWVLDRIDEAFGEIDTEGRELIAFALPRGWLNQPVDQWVRRKGKHPPLGCLAPVVVMDHDRRGPGRLQYQLKKVWSVLDRQPGSALHRIFCGNPLRPDQLSVQLQDVYAPVGLSRPPKAARDKELHRAVLEAPAPIVLWPRTGCEGDRQCGGSCVGTGFLDTLAEELSLLPPGELPLRVLELRKDAFLHQGAQPHWAEGLSLVWEDPRCFPEVRPLPHSPVG
jgi:hypothetical protein